MPQPRVFCGQCKKWLDALLEDYGKAVDLNTTGAFICGVQCHYLARWPMYLPHNEEWSAEFLAQVDDNAPIEEEDLSTYSVEQREEMSVALKLWKAVSQHLIPALAKLWHMMEMSQGSSEVECPNSQGQRRRLRQSKGVN